MADRRRRWPWWLLGTVVVLVLLWVGYWFAARYAAQTALARMDSGPVGGAAVTCAKPALGGFPFTLDLTCEEIRVASAGEQFTASVGTIAATAPLYLPGTLAANLKAPLTIAAPAMGMALETAWSDAVANINVGLGGLNGFDAHFTGLDANASGPGAGLPIRRVSAAEATAGISPTGGGSYTLAVNADTLGITRGDGSTLPALDVSGRVKLNDVGSSLGTDPAETLLTWLRNGGTADIEDLRISGAGATVSTSGQLTIDAQGRLSGGLLLRWNDIAKLEDLIEAIRPGSRDKLHTPLQMINAFSLQAETPEGPVRQASLALVNGTVIYNMIPLPIDPLPPLRF